MPSAIGLHEGELLVAICTTRAQMFRSAPTVWSRLWATAATEPAYCWKQLLSRVSWLTASVIDTTTGSEPSRKPTPPMPLLLGGTEVGAGPARPSPVAIW